MKDKDSKKLLRKTDGDKAPDWQINTTSVRISTEKATTRTWLISVVVAFILLNIIFLFKC